MKAAYCFQPIFADTLKCPQKVEGNAIKQLPAVWDADPQDPNRGLLRIRSARQLYYLSANENNGQSSYYVDWPSGKLAIEQEMDITYDVIDPKTNPNGKVVFTTAENSGIYWNTSPTISLIGTNVEFRSSYDPNQTDDANVYSLDQLTSNVLVKQNMGTIKNLYVTGSVYPSLVETNGSNNDALIDNITVVDSKASTAFIASTNANGTISNIVLTDCNDTFDNPNVAASGIVYSSNSGIIKNIQIHSCNLKEFGIANNLKQGALSSVLIDQGTELKDGIAKTITGTNVSGITIVNSLLRENGIADELNGPVIDGIVISNSTIGNTDSSIAGNGISRTSTAILNNIVISDSTIQGNGVVKELTGGSIHNAEITGTSIGKNGIAVTSTTDISDVVFNNVSIGDNGAVDKVNGGKINDVSIYNTTVGENGFAASSTNSARISNVQIVNANIGENGFIEKSYAPLTNCYIYSSSDAYQNMPGGNKYFVPFVDNADGYDLVTIGLTKNTDGTVKVNNKTNGFIDSLNGNVTRCSVTGTIYGRRINGFVGSQDGGTIDGSYSNAVMNVVTSGNSTSNDNSGFAGKVSGWGTIQNSHSTGIFNVVKQNGNSFTSADAKKVSAAGFVSNIDQAKLPNNYSAVWSTAQGMNYSSFYGTYNKNQKPELGTCQAYHSNQADTDPKIAILTTVDNSSANDFTASYIQYAEPYDSPAAVYPYTMPSLMSNNNTQINQLEGKYYYVSDNSSWLTSDNGLYVFTDDGLQVRIGKVSGNLTTYVESDGKNYYVNGDGSYVTDSNKKQVEVIGDITALSDSDGKAALMKEYGDWALDFDATLVKLVFTKTDEDQEFDAAQNTFDVLGLLDAEHPAYLNVTSSYQGTTIEGTWSVSPADETADSNAEIFVRNCHEIICPCWDG